MTSTIEAFVKKDSVHFVIEANSEVGGGLTVFSRIGSAGKHVWDENVATERAKRGV